MRQCIRIEIPTNWISNRVLDADEGLRLFPRVKPML
jgi:hypothetical protein